MRNRLVFAKAAKITGVQRISVIHNQNYTNQVGGHEPRLQHNYFIMLWSGALITHSVYSAKSFEACLEQLEERAAKAAKVKEKKTEENAVECP